MHITEMVVSDDSVVFILNDIHRRLRNQIGTYD